MMEKPPIPEKPEESSFDQQIAKILVDARAGVIYEHESSDGNPWLHCLSSYPTALRNLLYVEIKKLKKEAEQNSERIEELSRQLDRVVEFSNEITKLQGELGDTDPSDEKQEELLQKLESIFA